MPSYTGSSAAFIGVVIAVTGFNGQDSIRTLASPSRNYRLRPGVYPDWRGGDENRYPLD